MSKIFCQEVKTCGRCPNHKTKVVGNYPWTHHKKYCKKTRKKIDTKIPDWCPLPDKEGGEAQ